MNEKITKLNAQSLTAKSINARAVSIISANGITRIRMNMVKEKVAFIALADQNEALRLGISVDELGTSYRETITLLNGNEILRASIFAESNSYSHLGLHGADGKTRINIRVSTGEPCIALVDDDLNERLQITVKDEGVATINCQSANQDNPADTPTQIQVDRL